MPIFPVDLAAYLGGCARVQQQVFDLGEGLQVQNQTAGGEIIRAGGAARLWRGSLAIYPQRFQSARALHAKLHTLRGAGASFMVGDRTHKGPTFSALLSGVNAERTTISLEGVAAGREVLAGDYLAFGYAGRIALHQAVTGAQPNEGGVVGAIEVVPAIRPGYTLGVTVTVGAPKCRAVMIPGSARVGASNLVATDGITFDWVQTLREYP